MREPFSVCVRTLVFDINTPRTTMAEHILSSIDEFTKSVHILRKGRKEHAGAIGKTEEGFGTEEAGKNRYTLAPRRTSRTDPDTGCRFLFRIWIDRSDPRTGGQQENLTCQGRTIGTEAKA